MYCLSKNLLEPWLHTSTTIGGGSFFTYSSFSTNFKLSIAITSLQKGDNDFSTIYWHLDYSENNLCKHVLVDNKLYVLFFTIQTEVFATLDAIIILTEVLQWPSSSQGSNCAW